jgi:hypothetical protein
MPHAGTRVGPWPIGAELGWSPVFVNGGFAVALLVMGLIVGMSAKLLRRNRANRVFTQPRLIAEVVMIRFPADALADRRGATKRRCYRS